MLVGAVKLRMLASWRAGSVGGGFFLGILLLNLNLLQLLVLQYNINRFRTNTNIRLNGAGVSSILPIPN